jgi:hypothetical protein
MNPNSGALLGGGCGMVVQAGGSPSSSVSRRPVTACRSRWSRSGGRTGWARSQTDQKRSGKTRVGGSQRIRRWCQAGTRPAPCWRKSRRRCRGSGSSSVSIGGSAAMSAIIGNRAAEKGRKQAVRLHQPSHPVCCRPQPSQALPRSDFPVTPVRKGRGFNHLAARGQQVGVAGPKLRKRTMIRTFVNVSLPRTLP